MLLIMMLQGGKPSSNRSALIRQFEKDPQAFAVISGRLDSVAALRKHADEIKSESRERVRQVSSLFI